jgi:hypothetical protein
MLCVRPFRAAELVWDGKGVAFRYLSPFQAERYAEAEAILGVPRSGWVHGCAPCLLSRDGLAALREFLARRAAPGGYWLPLLAVPGWNLGNVYFTFLEAAGLDETYHVASGRSLAGNCVWSAREWPNWNPADSFDSQVEFFFSAVRPGSAATVSEVREKVDPFLGARGQAEEVRR